MRRLVLEIGLILMVLGLELVMLLVFLWPRAAHAALEPIDVPAKAVRGVLPGGSWEIIAGITPGEPILPSGVLVLDVKSDRVWVFEVWARTDHGWVQLQPGPGDGAFRNSLVAGVRLSAYRLWLARVGEAPDERPVREAAGLLVPAALLLTRARTASSPVAPVRAASPPSPSEVRPRSEVGTSRPPESVGAAIDE